MGLYDRPFTPSGLSRSTFIRGMTASGILLATGGLTACGGDSGGPDPAGSNTPAGPPKRGGTLTVGITGGRPTDTLDPNSGAINNVQAARMHMLYDALVVLDTNAEVRYDLAESITPNDTGTEWTIKLRPGVTFHDGKPLTAEDVIFTLQRILDPAAPLRAKASLGPVDTVNIAKIDDLTVRLPMLSPYSSLVEQMAAFYYFLFIAPVGWDVQKPVGTGPFVFESFTPNRQSKFVRNPSYWKEGRPYLDAVVVTDFAEGSAAANALISQQVNAVASVEATDLASFASNPAIKVLTSESGSWAPFTMRVDQAPFDDVRVRQAFRLIVDRQQIIDNALRGQGTVGNDVFSPYDPCYDAFPQRQQDIAEAKSLLKSAGQAGLTIPLTTTAVNQFAQMAQIFAENAKEAGVTVTVNELDNADYYGPNYGSYLFAHQYWLYNPYLPQVAQATLPEVPGNKTHFSNPKYVALYQEANATLDQDARCELSQQMMKIDFEEGGYIIPAFLKVNDAFDSKLVGFEPSRIGLSLANYGFADVSYA